MEEIRNVITHSSTASSSSPTPSAQGSCSHTRQAKEKDTSQGFQQKSADDSLIQVIEKLSKIVEKRPQRRCTSGGQKRGHQVGERGAEQGSRGSSDCKKSKSNYKEEVGLESSTADSRVSSHMSGDDNDSVTTTVAEVAANSNSSDHKRTVTCYQCSLCPYLSQTLPLLKEHLKQHNEQHSDLILMCSECHFTSTDHEQLEAHVRMHFDNVDDLKRNYPVSEAKGEVLKKQDVDQTGDLCSAGTEVKNSPVSSSKELPQKKKWYSYEEYGLYRCLICSYVCSQQRMLKTHAWKHAGLVDCSYPIFEDEDGGSAKREVQGASSKSATREEVVILQDKSLQKLPTAFKLQLCMPMAVEDKQEVLNLQVSNLSESPKTEEDEYPIKDLTSEEPMVEVQVTTEAETEVEIDGHHESSSVTDSLLSSAQKIINSSPNSAGHINVIVERLPSAEDSVMASNPLLLSPDVDGDKNLLEEKTEERDHVEGVKDELVLCYSPGNTNGAEIKSSVTKSSDSSRDENVPPAGRKRTHSESLRLHSLAAEALVAMPMRTPELPHSGAKASTKNVPAQAQSPQAGPKPTEVAAAGQKASDVGTAASLVNYGEGREGDLGSLGLGKGDEEGPAANVGISLSLLTVIERLRERSDQNASDEDILKELQDNAQFQNGAGVVAGNGAGSYVCSVPGMDGLVGSPDGSLVDYIPGSERPYRCRLCRYSSGNKGYIKQHLRVHRQRQPYQCPICEHIALDSKDLENHMIHHCKSRMYQCKQCPDAFHYKSQLRTHEREHHSISGDVAVLTPVAETLGTAEETERVTDDESLQKMYKCDVCSYTSSTYVGVRNHRRIHNSDKPYRCCSCDFATTNMNSLKSHMRRHPQEHQAVQLLEQYRCSLCGYVCSHPPSLKSHMWKHAGDQNYNYEQVNKAINEAISQSSRAPQKLSAVLESVAERPAVSPHSKDKAKSPVDPLLTPTSATKAGLSAESPAGLSTPPTDPTKWSPESLSPLGKDPAQLQSQSHPHTGQLPAPGPGMEYCVLLFCCCICGFESTSKERLMEHMKEHEGDIISIILNKEQQQPEAQTSLQTAE
ncbi:zinc finger protein 507 isoform X2 [Archocentrus centrarchus]|nr:zinc finger protein 507 isoform X2 [Archocentrus centrarchus]XP_030582243.1 zinc finger protein 507 isoform X2 [Archocentrus centrarchus]XP_030582244.1 zinc finger protein 507 isoform X2 [Archocentrus centrarchus]